MPTSKPDMTVDNSDWVLLTDKAATIQVKLGVCSVWFGDKPPINLEGSGAGKLLDAQKESEISFSTDSQCWCRASRLTKTARLSITEHA